jgi:hypothetical protein
MQHFGMPVGVFKNYGVYSQKKTTSIKENFHSLVYFTFTHHEMSGVGIE